jgi:IMP dehydrogenase
MGRLVKVESVPYREAEGRDPVSLEELGWSDPVVLTEAVRVSPPAPGGVMTRVQDVMSRKVVFVTRDALVRSAVELLRIHEIDAVPVVDGDRVVGLLDPLGLSLYDGEVSVGEILHETPLTVSADMPLTQAAMRMRSHRVRQVPVLRENEIVGLLSERDLLSIWGSVNDALTGLPVQHQLRRWVSANLAGGKEVGVLFLDLNNFGPLNKERGHVYGDRVLRAVADVLRDTVDPEQDFVCRYGGDEFAIATIRALSSAKEMAAQLRDRVSQLRIGNDPVGIGISIGLAGGRRVQPRSDAHIDATLDNLLTRASTASTAAKQNPDRICHSNGAHVDHHLESIVTGERPDDSIACFPRLIIDRCDVGRSGLGVEVTVTLRFGVEKHESRRVAAEEEVTRALALTTAECLENFASEPVQIRVQETYSYTSPQGLACVGATVALTRDAGRVTEVLVGTAPLRGDVHRTYVNAVLDATNRRIFGSSAQPCATLTSF